MNPSFTGLSLKNGHMYSNEFDGLNVFGIVGQSFFHFEEGSYFVFVEKGPK